MSVNDQFKEFTATTYSQQSVAFLNAYWDEAGGDCLTIWDITHQFIALDHESGKEGCDLDEFNAHRFLERLGETKTVKEMRDELREIDMDFNKRMALIEYLLWRYHKTVSDFVSKPQGGIDPEELAEAQRLVEEVNIALRISQAAAEEARRAEEEARRDEEEAKEAAEQARQRAAEAQAAADDARDKEADAVEKEKPFKIAQEELNIALDELHRQEEEYSRRCNELLARSEDPNLGTVQKNKAVNELAQLKSQDPLPLRQAKLTTEAAERKADKARAPFKVARELAEDARAEAERTERAAHAAREEAERTAKKAEKARLQAEAARRESDEKVEECYVKLQEAETKLHEVMSQPSVPQGQIWWLEHELEEAKKYLPKRKQ